jgi:glycosyltransferase involved in cell wall biosynthesis
LSYSVALSWGRTLDKPAEPEAWLLSAYRAGSHAAWADWLLASQRQWRWQRLELPGRFFAWRIRGNPLSWLDQLPASVPDLIVATAMVDLATLKGLFPRLARVPVIYYFHENQFAYPRSENQVASVEPQMVQIYGALAAQRILFNSLFNRDSFLEGVETLMAKMPDATPFGLRERLTDKVQVCPVPIEPVAAAPDKDERLILWNHRWEYDKAPGLFADAILAAAERGADFRLALLGSRTRSAPDALARLRSRLGGRIVADGRVDRDTYRRILGRAGIVVSTALHEFQGLAVLEAASAGARPLVPDALCYPEQYPVAYRYQPGDSAALAQRLRDWLSGELPAPVDVSAWYVASMESAWRCCLAEGQKQHVE